MPHGVKKGTPIPLPDTLTPYSPSPLPDTLKPYTPLWSEYTRGGTKPRKYATEVQYDFFVGATLAPPIPYGDFDPPKNPTLAGNPTTITPSRTIPGRTDAKDGTWTRPAGIRLRHDNDFAFLTRPENFPELENHYLGFWLLVAIIIILLTYWQKQRSWELERQALAMARLERQLGNLGEREVAKARMRWIRDGQYPGYRHNEFAEGSDDSFDE